MPAPARHSRPPIAAGLLLIALAGCEPATPPSGFGTRLAVGEVSVFHTPGVTAAQAERVGAALTRSGRIAERSYSVQVRYLNRRYEVRFPMRAGAEWATRPRVWREVGEAVSDECFDGSPVDVHLCDEHLTTLRVIPFEPIRPPLPVRGTTRPSVGGGSIVVQYRNESARHLQVRVGLRNPTLGRERAEVITIPPFGMTEHGWAEGWAYHSGDAITLAHADYETAEWTVP